MTHCCASFNDLYNEKSERIMIKCTKLARDSTPMFM